MRYWIPMPIRIVKLTEVPKRRRQAKPRIMQMADWAEVVKTLNAGALGRDEALIFTITPEEMEKHKIKNIRAAVRPLKAWLKKCRSPYKLSTKNTTEGAMVIFRWINPYP